MRCVNKTHIALQFREGRDEGNQTKCFDFFWRFLGVKNFFRFFWARKKNVFIYFFFFANFLKFYLQLSAVISLGRFRYQALPDLWSPRVWFTFRNKKVRRIKVVLKIEGHYSNFIFREKKGFFLEKKKCFFKEKKGFKNLSIFTNGFFFI